MSNRDIADDLVDAIDTKPASRFTKHMRGVVTDILMDMAVPWLLRCFQKYSEEDFHQKVLYEGFDFINDWKTNHADWYWDFVNRARNKVVKRFIEFDVDRIAAKVISLLHKKGWYIYPGEENIIMDTVRRLRLEIYGY